MVADGNGSAEAGPEQKNRFQFSILGLFCMVTAIALVLGVCLGISRAMQEAKRVRMTRDSFMCTGWSLKYYDERHGHLPFPVRREAADASTRLEKWAILGTPNGSGRALYSWRAEVATYRDNWFFNGGGDWDPSLPWSDPANKQMADYPWQFCYDALVGWEFPRDYNTDTFMMAITGPGTPLGDGDEVPKSLEDLDGDTILVVEVRDSGLHWMAPGDLDIGAMPRVINGLDGKGISSRHRGGFHALFADERIWFLSEDVPFDELEKFFTVEGAKKYDAEQCLGAYVLVRFKP